MRRRMNALLAVAVAASLVAITAPPGLASDRFGDVPDSNIFHDDITWLAEEDITRGCNPPDNDEFCPDDFVTRGQMAAFFVRALSLTSTDGGTAFTDTEGNIFEQDILRLSAADITRGCNPPDNDEFCPDDFITRQQMAAFFHRALGGPLELTVAHINDHHSHLQANGVTLTLDGQDTDVDMGGFARVATKIKEIEADNENVLKVHAGDAITGTLFYTLFGGEADAAVMSEVCFDTLTLGNHEFDDSDAGLAQFLDWLAEGDCDTAVLSANTNVAAGTPLADGYFEPYTIKSFNGKRVGIIGVTIANKTKNSSQPLESTTFDEEVETTQEYVDELEAMGVDRIIAATHYQYDNEQALAEAVEGLDVVVGGDSHSLLGEYDEYGLNPAGPYPTVTADPNGSMACVVQAWEFSNIVGQLDVVWNEDGEVTSCGGQPTLLLGDNFTREEPDPEDPEETIDVPVEGAELQAVLDEIADSPILEVVEEDAATAAIIASYAEEVDELAAEVIATVPETLCSERIPGQGQSTLCGVAETADHGGDIQQLVTEAFRVRSFEADIAIQNAGGVREDVAAGDFTIADAYELLPFANTMVNIEMTGAQVRQVLNEAFDYALLPDGSTGAYPYGAGIRWTTNFMTGDIEEIEVRLKGETDWSPLDDGATYTVVTNSFIAAGRDGYETFADLPKVDTGLDYAQSFIDYAVDDAGGVLQKLDETEEYSTHTIEGAYTP